MHFCIDGIRYEDHYPIIPRKWFYEIASCVDEVDWTHEIFRDFAAGIMTAFPGCSPSEINEMTIDDIFYWDEKAREVLKARADAWS